MFQGTVFFNGKKDFFRSACLLFMLPVSLIAIAQNGRLTGKVTDASTNQTLAGVSVNVKGTKSGIASITDGTYILSLPAGTYTISYSYTGYNTKEITGVVIKAAETTFLDIILETSSRQLQGVVVTTNVRRETQSSVYSAQKRSSAVSDGISQESIRKTPDNNAGQILRRVTGVNVQDNRFVVVRGLGEQYNQTMLNGAPMTSTETNRNAFAFDLIPAAAIDNITINKTATPDMPGNFAGGIVQVNTRDFPASDFFSISLQGGFSDETYRKDFFSDKRYKYEWLSFGGGIRDLPKNFPSSTSRVPFPGLNLQERTRYLRTLTNNLAPVNYGPSGLNENVQLGYGKTIRLKNETQLGIIAAINHRKTELIEEEITQREPDLINGHLTRINYYSENIRYRYSVDLGGVLNIAYRFGNNKITLKNMYTRVFNNMHIDRPYVYIESFDRRGDPYKQVGTSYITEERGLLNSILAGEHRTGKGNETKIDWNVNMTLNNINTPDTRNFLFNTDSARTFLSGDQSAPDISSALERYSRSWSVTDDLIYGGAFNITTPFDLWKNKQLFKGGILFQNRRRNVTGTVLPIQNIKGTIDSILAPSNFYPGGGEVVIATADFVGGAGNYDAGSSLLAAYESLEHKIGGKLRVIWGLRVENYQQQVNVYNPSFYNNFQEPERIPRSFAARTTFNFLPSANLVYSPFTSINLRAAYSNTVIRPELKDLAEFPRYDFTTLQLTQGNGELRSTSIQNLDLKLEWFPSSGEIVSVAAFYKDLQDPIEYARPTKNALKLRIPLNTGDAFVKGVEAEIRKKIDFIPGIAWLKNVTLFGNGALLQSKVSTKPINSFLYDSITAHTLTGQPDYILNAGINISAFKNTFEITLSYNRTGDYINELGSFQLVHLTNGNIVPTIPHYYVKARDMADLVVSQSILKNKGKIRLSITNLLKSRYILYQDLNGNGRYDDPPLTIMKFSGDPGLAPLGIDGTASDIKPQRTFSFSVSYTF